MNIKRIALTGSISNVIGRIAKKGVVTVITIILIRNLTVREYGVFSLFVSVVTMIGALSFGIDHVFQRFFPMHINEDKGKGYEFFVLLFVARYAVCFMVLAIGAALFELGYLDPSRFDFGYIDLAVVVGIFFVGHTFLSLALNSAYFEYRFLNTVFVLGDLVKLILLTMHQELKIDDAVLIWGIGEGLVFVVVGARFIQKLRPSLKTLKIKIRGLEFTRYFDYMKYMVLASGATYVLSIQVDLYFLSYYVDNEAVGLYAFATKIPFMLVLLAPSNVMFNVVSPILFRKVDQGARLSERKDAIRTFLKLNIICWSVIMGITLVNVKLIIRYVFDEKYIQTVPLISIWFLLLYGNVTKNVFEPVARAIEFTKVYLFMAIAAVLNVTGNFLLIPEFGINGAVASTGLSTLVHGTGISFVIAKKIGMEIEVQSIVFTLGRIGILATILFLCNQCLSTGVYEVIGANAVMLGALSLLFWPGKWFTNDEISYIKSFLRRR